MKISLRKMGGGTLRGAANSEFKIQDSKLRGLFGYARAYIPVRAAACGVHAKFGNELRASAAGRLRPARPLPRSIPVASDKPAAERWACTSGLRDAKMQPSAGGRLRAAAPVRAQFIIQNSRFKITNRAAACRGHARSGPSGRELRAFAGRSCGPLRFHSEPQIHDSKFNIQDSKLRREAFRVRLGIYFRSGRGLRRAQRREGVAGLRRPQAAAR